MNVVLYLRVSTEKQDTSIADQRAALKKAAKDRRYTVVREYVDDGISGDATEKRLAFQRMIADSAAGDFDLILCWDQDRFGRFDALEAGYWIKPLKDAGIALETIAQGRIDWNDFAGRMMFAIQQEAKHTFLRDLSRNVSRGMVAAFLAGKWQGGPAPYGYKIVDSSLAIDKEKAKYVRVIYKRFLDGQSAHEVAAWLNKAGVVSNRQKLWTSTTVLKILRQELYTGVHVWNRKTKSKYIRIKDGVAHPSPSRTVKSNGEPTDSVMRVPNHHPAIVSTETWQAVQAEMPNRRKRTTPAKAKAVYALTGLIYCAQCGGRMHGRRRGRHPRPFYCCGAGIHKGTCLPNFTPQEELLVRIGRKLTAVLDTRAFRRRLQAAVLAELQAAPPSDDRRAAQSRLRTVEQRLANAKRRLVECDRDMLPIVQEQIRELQFEEQQLSAIVATPVPKRPATLAKECVARFMDLRSLFTRDLDARAIRDSIAEFVTRIDVHVGNEPIEGRKVHRYWLVKAVLHMKAGEDVFLFEV